MQTQQLHQIYDAITSIPTFLHMHVDKHTDNPGIEEIKNARDPDARRKAALYYAALGVPVFPCREGLKQPAIAGGFKNATTNLDQIQKWWTQNPNYNIGIPTGIMFDVIDLDNPLTGWGEIAADIQAGKISPFHVVYTPRGYHFYIPPAGRGNSTNAQLGIDYRGSGGYVLAPPSILDPAQNKRGGIYRHPYGWPTSFTPQQ